MANNQLLASDNFASGSLAAGWSAVPGQSSCQVIAGSPNYTEANAVLTPAGQIWTGLTWPNDQASEVTITMTGSAVVTTLLQLHVRNQGGGSYSGYRAIVKDSGAWEIDVVTAGTPTVLASGTGLTIAANDIWVLQAAGSCISLYQNGNRVGYVGDATYTLGSPGYSQEATTTLSTNEVYSWRGYSAVQQDGVWQKQGIVLAPQTADLASSGIGVYEGCAIYDSNPQILAGPNVYKLWFSAGPLTSSSVWYAESPDLIHWTRSGSAVVANVVSPTVIKNGSTYYLYCQAASNPGSGVTQLYTSTNGTSWTLQNASLFATGSYPLKPIAIIGGTWYALWGHLGTAGFAVVNLATSPDGLTWTNSGSNPVISAQSTYPYPCFTNINGTYYVWMQKGPSAPQNSAASDAFDPTECIRFSTIDFVHWSAPVISLHHSQMHESLNTPVNNTEAVGGTAPVAIFDVAGKATMLYLLSQGDNIGPVVAQFSVAVAPAPIASVVQFNEDAVQQTATDNFSYGAGPLSGNWTTPSTYLMGAWHVVSGNLAEPVGTSSQNSGAIYTGASFGSNFYSEIKINTLNASPLSPCLFAGTTGEGYVLGTLLGTLGTLSTSAQIGRYQGGVLTVLGPSVGITPTANDVWRLEAVKLPIGNGGASAYVLSFYQNGSLITQAVDYSPLAITFPGFYGNQPSAGKNRISLFAAGNANVIPAYLPAVWSPVDCRAFGHFPNSAVLQPSGAEFYTGQTSSNPKLPPTNSDPKLPPTDSRAGEAPKNSRNNPPF
jgi:hypothetical protein